MILFLLFCIAFVIPEVRCYARAEKIPKYHAYVLNYIPAPVMKYSVCGYVDTPKTLTITIADQRPWLNETSSVSLKMIYNTRTPKYRKMLVTNFRQKNVTQVVEVLDPKPDNVLLSKPKGVYFFCAKIQAVLREEPPKTLQDHTNNGYFIDYVRRNPTDDKPDFLAYHHKDFLPYVYVENANVVKLTQSFEDGPDEQLRSVYANEYESTLRRYAYLGEFAWDDEFMMCGGFQEKVLRVSITDRKPWLGNVSISVDAFYLYYGKQVTYVQHNTKPAYLPWEKMTEKYTRNIGFHKDGRFCIKLIMPKAYYIKGFMFVYPFDSGFIQETGHPVELHRQLREFRYLTVQGAKNVIITKNGKPLRQLSTVVSKDSHVYELTGRGEHVLQKTLEVCFEKMINREKKIHLRFLSALPAEHQKMIHLLVELDPYHKTFFVDYTGEDGIFTSATEKSEGGQKQTDIDFTYRDKFCMRFEIEDSTFYLTTGDENLDGDLLTTQYPGNAAAIKYLKIDGVSGDDILHVKDEDGLPFQLSLKKDSEDYDVIA